MPKVLLRFPYAAAMSSVEYDKMSSVKEQWMSYRAAHCPEEDVGSIVTDESPSNGHMTDEVQLFERLMGHVKELMSITPG